MFRTILGPKILNMGITKNQFRWVILAKVRVKYP